MNEIKNRFLHFLSQTAFESTIDQIPNSAIVFIDSDSNKKPTIWTHGKYYSNYYTLPIASATVLGGVKVGAGLSITNDGVLSVDNLLNTVYGRIFSVAMTTSVDHVYVQQQNQRVTIHVTSSMLADSITITRVNDDRVIFSDQSGLVGTYKKDWTYIDTIPNNLVTTVGNTITYRADVIVYTNSNRTEYITRSATVNIQVVEEGTEDTPVITITPTQLTLSSVNNSGNIEASVINGNIANVRWRIDNEGITGNTFRKSTSSGSNVNITANNTSSLTRSKGTVNTIEVVSSDQTSERGEITLRTSFTKGSTNTLQYETNVTAYYEGNNSVVPKVANVKYLQQAQPYDEGGYTWSWGSIFTPSSNLIMVMSNDKTVTIYNYGDADVYIPIGGITVANDNGNSPATNTSPIRALGKKQKQDPTITVNNPASTNIADGGSTTITITSSVPGKLTIAPSSGTGWTASSNTASSANTTHTITISNLVDVETAGVISVNTIKGTFTPSNTTDYNSLSNINVNKQAITLLAAENPVPPATLSSIAWQSTSSVSGYTGNDVNLGNIILTYSDNTTSQISYKASGVTLHTNSTGTANFNYSVAGTYNVWAKYQGFITTNSKQVVLSEPEPGPEPEPTTPDYYVGWVTGANSSFTNFENLTSQQLLSYATGYTKSSQPSITKRVTENDLVGNRQIFFLMWRDSSVPTGAEVNTGLGKVDIPSEDFTDDNVFNAQRNDVIIDGIVYHVAGVRSGFAEGNYFTINF